MNRKRSIAFTVELLGLFILLILVIVMITRVFVMSRAGTLEARRLNQAVMIAQSTAEAASSESDLEALAGRMNEMDNVQEAVCDAAGGSVAITFDTDGKPDGRDFCVVLNRSSEDRAGGAFVTDHIEVYYCEPGQLEGKIYDLDTGRFFENEEAGS